MPSEAVVTAPPASAAPAGDRGGSPASPRQEATGPNFLELDQTPGGGEDRGGRANEEHRDNAGPTDAGDDAGGGGRAPDTGSPTAPTKDVGAATAGQKTAEQLKADKVREFYLPKAKPAAGAPPKPGEAKAGEPASDKKPVSPELHQKLTQIKPEELAAALEAVGLDANDAKQLVDISSEVGRAHAELGEARKAAAAGQAIAETFGPVVVFDRQSGKIQSFDALALVDRAVRELTAPVALKTLHDRGVTIVEISKLQALKKLASVGGDGNGTGNGAASPADQALRAVGKQFAAQLSPLFEGTGVTFDAEHMPIEALDDAIAASPAAVRRAFQAEKDRLTALAQADEQTRQTQARAEEQQRFAALDALEKQWETEIPDFGELKPLIAQRFDGLYDKPRNQGGRIQPPALMTLAKDAVLGQHRAELLQAWYEGEVRAGVEAELKRRGYQVNGERGAAQEAEVTRSPAARKTRLEQSQAAERETGGADFHLGRRK